MFRILGAMLVVVAGAAVASASNEFATLARSSSGMVFLNEWVLGYSSLGHDRVLWLQHEAEAADFVRRALVRQGKIQNVPLHVTITADGGPSGISIDSGCTVAEGQVGKLIGRCYSVGYRHPGLSSGRRDGHENLLALTVSLAQLSPTREEIEFENLGAARNALATEMAPFKGIALHFDPVWSPDGRRLIYLVWSDGRVHFELLDPASGAVRQLEPLRGYVAVRPVWSPDSRYVAVASLRDVRIVDVRTGSAQTVRPARMTERWRATIDLRFVRDGRLLIVFDTSEPTGPLYTTYSYNPDSRDLVFVGAGAAPSWIADLGDWPAAHASLRPVRSPTGRYVAFIRYVDGLRRVAVDRLR